MPVHVAVVTPDVVGERMAGPGIRALHMARELARVAEVTLVARHDASSTVSDVAGADRVVRSIQHGSSEAARVLRDADVLIGQPARGFIRRRASQRVVYDLFDPQVLELRELYGSAPSFRQRIHLAAEWARLVFALRDADLLVRAAPAQRDFYGRLQWADVPWIEIPFGVDPRELTACEKPRSNLVVWAGGVWEWLDPRTAVEAILMLNREGLDCRLLFLGRARPNQGVVERRRESRFDQLLAAGGPFVSANEGWVPYRERLSWLRSAKAAIMLHRKTAEASYAIRTRLFDSIAAGVPLVASAGGFAADLVRSEGLGIVVPPEEPGAVAGAVRRLLTDDVFHSRCVENLERVRPAYSWPRVMQPLLDAVTEWERSKH